MGRAQAVAGELSRDLVDQVAAVLKDEGARRVNALAPSKLSKKVASALATALAERGFERAGTFVRVPLAEQLARLLAREPVVPVRELRKRLSGTTSAAEIGALIREQHRQRRIVVVMREGREYLAPAATAVLAPESMAELSDRIARLQKLLRSTKAKPGQPKRTLLESDVRSLIPSWLLGKSDPVLGAIDAMIEGGAPLVFVPALVERLKGAVEPGRVRQSLIDLAGRGTIELRPESGAGLLSAKQAALCPRGPGGAPLSYLRRR